MILDKMNILVISARYPPFHLGGYGLRIKNIIDELYARGHTVRVLTTNKTKGDKNSDPDPSYLVHRKLHNRNHARFFPKEILFDLLDTKFLEQQIEEFNPDLIYLGHIYILSKALLPYLANVNIPIVLDEGGASLKGAWTEHGRWFRFTGDYGKNNPLIRAVKPLFIKLVCWLSRGRIKRSWVFPDNIRVIFNNETNLGNVQALDVPMKNARVIHSGIDINLFSFKHREALNTPIKILYPARIEPLKGQMDAIHLMKRLRDDGFDANLTIVGPIFSSEYFQELTKTVETGEIVKQVKFLPMVSQDELVKMYQGSDICFFPSYHKMGFSRTPLEAMACGCVVVSYGNEASAEIIQDNQTGFIVSENDIRSTIQVIKKLSDKHKLLSSVVFSARKQIENQFSIHRYVTRIEAFLLSVLSEDD